jgi:hypothetical protein
MEGLSQKVIQYIIGFAVILMGIAAYISDLVPNRELLLILFVVYGLWRLYRGYKM